MDEIQRIDKLAKDILMFARNAIIVNLRFFGGAIARIELIPSEVTVATNGTKLFYNPVFLLRKYQNDPNSTIRIYIHAVLHCVFQHMFVSLEINHELWDLSCDIAVEAAASELIERYYAVDCFKKQERELDNLREEIGALTAERIYHYFNEKSISAERFAILKALFTCDDHAVWYLHDKNATTQDSDERITDKQDSSTQACEDQSSSERDASSKSSSDDDLESDEQHAGKQDSSTQVCEDQSSSESDASSQSSSDDDLESDEQHAGKQDSSTQVCEKQSSSESDASSQSSSDDDLESDEQHVGKQDSITQVCEKQSSLESDSSSQSSSDDNLESDEQRASRNDSCSQNVKGKTGSKSDTSSQSLKSDDQKTGKLSSAIRDSISQRNLNRDRPSALEAPDPRMEKEWKKISEQIQKELETFSQSFGKTSGTLTQNLREINREKYDYSEFLSRFMVMGETMKINDDEFDYIFYTYGLKEYGNMPLVEPLEYKETKYIKDLVIAIDTSGSVSGELVQSFLQITFNIIKQRNTNFTNFVIHIIQCDAAIKEDIRITSTKELDEYFASMKIRGFGGTDFRPVFDYVDSLVQKKEFTNLKGLIYFTDGFGSFPPQMPHYQTAFVFVNDDPDSIPSVPPWAIKLVLPPSDLMLSGNRKISIK